MSVLAIPIINFHRRGNTVNLFPIQLSFSICSVLQIIFLDLILISIVFWVPKIYQQFFLVRDIAGVVPETPPGFAGIPPDLDPVIITGRFRFGPGQKYLGICPADNEHRFVFIKSRSRAYGTETGGAWMRVV